MSAACKGRERAADSTKENDLQDRADILHMSVRLMISDDCLLSLLQCMLRLSLQPEFLPHEIPLVLLTYYSSAGYLHAAGG